MKLVAPLALLLLSACSASGERLTLLERRPPGDLVAPCPGEPAPPDVAGDRALALWVNDVRSAGRECRLKHACLARWARGESVEADDACKVERPGR